MTRYFEKCLILQARDTGEDSFSISVLHASWGKQEFLVQGGKKIGAKLSSLLQPLTLADIWVAASRREGGRVIEARVINDFTPLKKKFLALRFALRALDILKGATYGLIETHDLMQVTLAVFEAIQIKKSTVDLKKLWIAFELAVLNHLGIKPSDASLTSHASLNKLAHYLEQEIYQAC